MINTDRCEINIVRHCNNSCSCCNHASPLADEYFMEPEVLRRDLAEIGKIMHTGFLCLQGGEPLLHPKIIEFLDVQIKSGFANQYGILSNGKLLNRMPEEFFKKCGSMAVNGNKFQLRVSVYPNVDAKMIEEYAAKSADYGFELRPGPIGSFWKLFMEQKDGGKYVWQHCYARDCHTIHEGYFYHCPLAAFFPSQFHGWDEHIDGIKIEGTTEQQMAAFIARPEPLKTCSKCTAGTQWTPWKETRDRKEWIKEATHDTV